jgi:hypothetical protein
MGRTAWALRSRGWSISAIVACLCHDRKTIRTYLKWRTAAGGAGAFAGGRV